MIRDLVRVAASIAAFLTVGALATGFLWFGVVAMALIGKGMGY